MQAMKRVCPLVLTLLWAVLVAASADAAPLPAQSRSYAGSRYALELDGVFAGWVKSVDGGNAVADVVEEQLGPTYYRKKHLASLNYRAMTLSVGPAMSQAFYDWIAASMMMNYQRKNGAIVAVDYKGNVRAVTEFYEALITEIGFPALDAAMKEPATFTVVAQPEYTRRASARIGTKYIAPVCQKTAPMLASNFRVFVDNIQTNKVRAVDGFAVTIELADSPIGEGRDYEKEPVTISFPHVVLTVPESSAQDFTQWFDDFVIAGNNDDGHERGGRIEYLSPALGVMFTLDMSNIGIFKMEPVMPAGAQDAISQVAVSLYVERMAFSNSVAGCQ